MRLSFSSLIMMMLVTKDSEDDVDLDQEVAYHVCAAGRARRDDVRRAYTICEIFNTEISVGFTLSKHKLYEWFHAGCHARASKREAPRADGIYIYPREKKRETPRPRSTK